MRVSLNTNNSTGCQPLKFRGDAKKAENKTSGHCCNSNIDQKYDLACRIIALQKQQILALKAKDKK